MTAPIQEPTEGRTTSGLGYGQRQLFRRPAPASGIVAEIPWARRAHYDTSDQSIPDGVQEPIALNTFFTDYPIYFQAHDVGTQDGIEVQLDGMYAISFRLFWDDWPNSHQVSFSGIDPDAWSDYSFNQSDGGFNSTSASVGGWTQRLEAGAQVYMSVAHGFGSPRSLEGFCGTYFEMAYLGAATVNYLGCDLNPAS